MPVISGIALLYKIMNHKTFKTIPVIMMSSHDSMGIVFKCLSKGAVDFLVKPIRKNELKNLWQHVWRRCHSSSGSGSESGTQSRRSTGAKGNGQSQDNSSSSGEREGGSIGLSLHDGSDDGSGAQSSWTKKAAEAISPQPTGECMADAPDSTCAQVIHAKPETASYSRLHLTEAVESPEEDDQHENTSPGKDQDADISSDPIDSDQPLERFEEQPSGTEHINRKNALDLEFKPADAENVTNNLANANKACANLSPINPQTESRSCEPSNGYSNFSFKDKANFEMKECPSLELKLEAGVSDVRTTLQGDCNILGHSDVSAFSKYISGPSASQKESSGRPVKPGKTKDAAINSSQVEPRDLNQVYVEHHHHHHHHYHHHVHDMQKHKASKDLDQCALKEAPLAAPQCRSSNAINGPVELNPGNYSTNGSGSGSNHGSNGQNGSSILTLPNAGTTNTKSDTGMPVNNASDDCKGKTGTSGSDEDRFAHREAALTKFRQKRKERCFEKKVRYQSRKKLADQRPRVRGQFVRHNASEEKPGQDSQSDGLTPGDNSCDGFQ
uniref:Pseudo-response regulator 7 n=1 Tax=Kalanchoe fedtschenkoi TaxID=63787 RepID=A0A7N0RAP4_KALFE